MTLIADNQALTVFCERLAGEDFITVDTEFIRDKTYWPRLCLIQMAGADVSAAIDTLAPGLDLAPVYALLSEPRILKVFHAARQDIEIFFHQARIIPAPLFDSQVAAMVCGFGDAASYETLVAKLAKAQVDKSSRFTDWAARPLTDKQLTYALSDVTYLRTIYQKLSARLERDGRSSWLEDEMAALTAPEIYQLDPDKAWRRIKLRNPKPRYLAVLREIAAWREREARSRDVPRNRIVRDEALTEIAAHPPRGTGDLARIRSLSRGFAEGKMGAALLDAAARGLAVPDAECPQPPAKNDLPPGLGPVVELLKVLLKMRCEESGVATKLVASSANLERIAASDTADVPALAGWRRELFGEDALALKNGRLALQIDGRKLRAVPVGENAG